MYNILNRIFVVTPGHALGVALKESVGVQKLSFTEHTSRHVAYQIKEDDELNIKQNFCPKEPSQGVKRSYLM